MERGKVVKTKYKRLRKEIHKNKTFLLIEILLPEEMKNRKLDMFLIQTAQQSRKVNIKLLTQRVQNRVNLLIKKLKNSKEDH